MFHLFKKFRLAKKMGMCPGEREAPCSESLLDLRQLFELAPIGLFLLDQDFHILYINEWMVEFNGKPVNEQVGQALSQVNSQCSEYFAKVFRSVVEKGESVLNFEFQCFVPPASVVPRYWLLNCVPVKGRNGKVSRIIGTLTEFTEKKKVETYLRADLAGRDEFLSILSHELRTPLTSLDLRVQLFNKELKKEKSQGLVEFCRKFEKIVKGSQTLVKWVDVLLDLTRIQFGRISLRKQEVNFNEIVSECVLSLSAEAERVGSHVTVKEASKGRVIGFWDPFRIEQIVSNLLSNAIKYGLGNPIEIIITVFEKEGFLRLSVRDEGIGISFDHQSEIFRRFKRVSPDRKIDGLGLGLYIVRQLIEAHRGTIRVISEPGRGALFICDLPLKAKDREEEWISN
ncbi:MAG: PAS domain-containing sensor histidine kinase [Bdellovibrionia bacterium]